MSMLLALFLFCKFLEVGGVTRYFIDGNIKTKNEFWFAISLIFVPFSLFLLLILLTVVLLISYYKELD